MPRLLGRAQAGLFARMRGVVKFQNEPSPEQVGRRLCAVCWLSLPAGWSICSCSIQLAYQTVWRTFARAGHLGSCSVTHACLCLAASCLMSSQLTRVPAGRRRLVLVPDGQFPWSGVVQGHQSCSSAVTSCIRLVTSLQSLHVQSLPALVVCFAGGCRPVLVPDGQHRVVSCHRAGAPGLPALGSSYWQAAAAQGRAHEGGHVARLVRPAHPRR